MAKTEHSEFLHPADQFRPVRATGHRDLCSEKILSRSRFRRKKGWISIWIRPFFLLRFDYLGLAMFRTFGVGLGAGGAS